MILKVFFFLGFVATVLASAISFSFSDQAIALATLNQERAIHGVAPLHWSETLAAHAHNWAFHIQQQGQIVHANEFERANQGEVIAAFASFDAEPHWTSPVAHAVQTWLTEGLSYPPGSVIGDGTESWAHWSQLVWAKTTEIGCGVAQSHSENMFKTFVVCRLAPEGNIVGEAPFTPAVLSTLRLRQDDAAESFHGDLTHFTTGLGACGHDDSGAGGIIALSHIKMGPLSNTNPYCNRRIRLHANGRTVEGVVRDKCMGCAEQDVDVSEDLFIALYDDLGIGRAPVTWYFI